MLSFTGPARDSAKDRTHKFLYFFEKKFGADCSSNLEQFFQF